MPLSVNPKLEARCKLQQTTGQYPRQLVAADHIKRSFMKYEYGIHDEPTVQESGGPTCLFFQEHKFESFCQKCFRCKHPDCNRCTCKTS
ncbi:hypothetical protein PCASD_16016 [Puccinia coronata f. sp. avenae]|uniref:Uncharacterized protein n=1 Tax=Puccinia coronata f. sp. avenae TaxID=200324 RepID=A0A2N5TZT9_9BASI|nr:hypothetical protein PCASD_16016 [Puccinia coronata f. sp. avenae]